jgi:hypothetical protein
MIMWGKKIRKYVCKACDISLKPNNTSCASKDAGYCHTCHNNLVNKGVIKP